MEWPQLGSSLYHLFDNVIIAGDLGFGQNLDGPLGSPTGAVPLPGGIIAALQRDTFDGKAEAETDTETTTGHGMALAKTKVALKKYWLQAIAGIRVEVSRSISVRKPRWSRSIGPGAAYDLELFAMRASKEPGLRDKLASLSIDRSRLVMRDSDVDLEPPRQSKGRAEEPMDARSKAQSERQ